MASNWQRWKGIQKCYPFEEKRLMKWQPPYIIQPKYDGFRCRAVFLETAQRPGYVLLSSEENLFYSVPHLNEILNNLGLRAELDGELYYHGMDFDSLSSIVSRTVNIHPEHQRMQLHLFDIVNDQPQMNRLITLDSLKGLHPHIQVAPFWLCETLKEVMDAYDKIIDLGYEGIIVRHFQAPYQRKRSTMVMKLKPKKEDIYKIIGYKEEYSINNIPKGRLGALICVGIDGTEFSVGSGFNDEDRDNLWKIRDQLANNYVRIVYQHLTSGRKAPRFPIYMEVIDYERALEDDPSISSL